MTTGTSSERSAASPSRRARKTRSGDADPPSPEPPSPEPPSPEPPSPEPPSAVIVRKASCTDAPLPADLRPAFDAQLDAILVEATLTKPSDPFAHKGGRTGFRHTEHLGHLLSSMQWLQRAYPGAQW